MQLTPQAYRCMHLALVLTFILMLGCKVKNPWALTEVEIAELALPSVVTIKSLDETGRVIGTGSGFIIHSGGVVVTNHHVIENAHAAQVILASGESHNVDGLVHVDPSRDIAFLRVHAVNLKAIELADSDKLTLGEKTLAIGSPLGLEKTVTNGIVSQVRQEDGVRVIQHTAPISPGSSGGPLLNSEAKVIGINTFYLAKGQSLYFAMPSNYLTPYTHSITVTKTLAAYNKIRSEEKANMALEDLKKSLAMFNGPDDWVKFIIPKNYITSVNNEVDQEGSRSISMIAVSPDAERDGRNGWLSDGIRVGIKIAPQEKVWTDEFQSNWGPARVQSLLGAYDKHYIEEKKEASMAGMSGVSVFVKGTSPAISGTEASYFHLLVSPKCLATIEVTAPATDAARVLILNELLVQSFETGCPH